MQVDVGILRYDPERDAAPHWESYRVETEPMDRVLEQRPDDLVVGGQAFTEYPEGMQHLEAAFAARSVLPPRDIRVTAFGNRVQEAGAGIVSLAGLYADPLGAMRRAQPPVGALQVATETPA